jgi:hypothetical protein
MTNEALTTEQRMLKLLQRLHAKTAEGQVQWELTASENVFQSPFSNYVVRIVLKPSPNSGESPDYFLNIKGADGKIVESASDVAIEEAISGSKAFALMKQLHDMARRQVLGVDEALDSLLSELE